MKGLRAKFNSLSWSDPGSGLRSIQAASAQRAVLESLSCSIVVFDDLLINTANGEYRQITGVPADSEYARIARAASSLLGPQASQQKILLLLPPAHFVATRYSLNIGNEKLLRSALSLQSHSLIPAFDEKLMLAVSGNQGTGTALWYPERAANNLFDAFRECGVQLGAIMPRSLALLDISTDSQSVSQQIVDVDKSHECVVMSENGLIKNLLVVSQRDLKQDVFIQQWSLNIDSDPATKKVSVQQASDWTGLRRQIFPVRGYTFIPQKSENNGSQAIRVRQKRWAAIAASVLVFLLCVPFISIAVQKMRLNSQLEQFQLASEQARSSQAFVTELEEIWGAVSQYPQQDVGQVLLTLNSFINSGLSSFTLNKGVVDINGYTQDPALLIEQLSEREEFYDVGQSRSSSAGNAGSRGDRFGIRLNVSDVDYPGYEAVYPATQ